MKADKKIARRTLAAIAGLLALVGMASPSWALLVRPIVLDIDSTGRAANGQIEVVNDRNRPVTVEIAINSFTLPERGEMILGEEGAKDFVVFPAIAKLPAGGRQVFRIRYVGDPALAKSKLYMFASSELPVSDTGTSDSAQIEVLYSISTMVAVRTPSAKAAINVVGIERETDAQGVAGLRMTFRNDGAAHGYIGGSILELASGAWKDTLDTSETSKAFGLGLIPAQSRRSLFVPLADAPATGAISAEIKAAVEG